VRSCSGVTCDALLVPLTRTCVHCCALYPALSRAIVILAGQLRTAGIAPACDPKTLDEVLAAPAPAQAYAQVPDATPSSLADAAQAAAEAALAASVGSLSPPDATAHPTPLPPPGNDATTNGSDSVGIRASVAGVDAAVIDVLRELGGLAPIAVDLWHLDAHQELTPTSQGRTVRVTDTLPTHLAASQHGQVRGFGWL